MHTSAISPVGMYPVESLQKYILQPYTQQMLKNTGARTVIAIPITKDQTQLNIPLFYFNKLQFLYTTEYADSFQGMGTSLIDIMEPYILLGEKKKKESMALGRKDGGRKRGMKEGVHK